jgi:hypothetical protein
MKAMISGLALQQHERPARRAADRSTTGALRRCGLACLECVAAAVSGMAPLGCEEFADIHRGSPPQGRPEQGLTASVAGTNGPAGGGISRFSRDGSPAGTLH